MEGVAALLLIATLKKVIDFVRQIRGGQVNGVVTQLVAISLGRLFYPVLSMQWEKPAPDTVDQTRDYFGPARFAILEPGGFLAKAGAPIAYGSDWPVDALNEWFALKVGITRENDPSAGPAYAGRLGDDPGLTPLQALRAITIMAARQLHCDEAVGSLEVGKLADMAVLDRDPLTIDPHEIAHVKVLATVVGGKTVYRAH